MRERRDAIAIPPWLLGRWTVDASRLDADRKLELGRGVIDISLDGLAHHGFAKGAQIFDQRWSRPIASALEGGVVQLDCEDFDELWLRVLERDGDRLLVYLGGIDVLPWGREMPLVKVSD